MNRTQTPGLGELLRYLGELVDQGANHEYRAIGLSYRPRYTPILRAIDGGACTVTDITDRTYLTQGAVSQSVALMEKDGLIARHPLDDGRKSCLRLTAQGEELLQTLRGHWSTTFAAIQTLEAEIRCPLMRILEDTACALEREDFSARLRAERRAAAGVNDQERTARHVGSQ